MCLSALPLFLSHHAVEFSALIYKTMPMLLVWHRFCMFTNIPLAHRIASLPIASFIIRRHQAHITTTTNTTTKHHLYHSDRSTTMSSFATTKAWAQVMRQGSDNPVQLGLPAGIAPSLESALPRKSISCSQCQQPVVPAQPGTYHPAAGKILWLPHLAALSPTSVVRHPEAGVNDGAGNHPCVAAMASACGCLAFCMPMTSFSGRGIVHKYAHAENPREHFEQYMPLAERDTPATHSAGLLHYEGERMQLQSYVHLEMGYWIEWANLKARKSSFLSFPALAMLKLVYAAAEVDRQGNGGSRAKARLARRSRSPPSPSSSQASSRSPSPPTMGALSSGPWRSQLPSPPPSPPPFVLPQRGNAAVTIRKPPSQEKLEAMSGCWR